MAHRSIFLYLFFLTMVFNPPKLHWPLIPYTFNTTLSGNSFTLFLLYFPVRSERWYNIIVTAGKVVIWSAINFRLILLLVCKLCRPWILEAYFSPNSVESSSLCSRPTKQKKHCLAEPTGVRKLVSNTVCTLHDRKCQGQNLIKYALSRSSPIAKPLSRFGEEWSENFHWIARPCAPYQRSRGATEDSYHHPGDTSSSH